MVACSGQLPKPPLRGLCLSISGQEPQICPGRSNPPQICNRRRSHHKKWSLLAVPKTSQEGSHNQIATNTPQLISDINYHINAELWAQNLTGPFRSNRPWRRAEQRSPNLHIIWLLQLFWESYLSCKHVILHRRWQVLPSQLTAFQRKQGGAQRQDWKVWGCEREGMGGLL